MENLWEAAERMLEGVEGVVRKRKRWEGFWPSKQETEPRGLSFGLGHPIQSGKREENV